MLLSIIIPVYKVEQYIERCIKSCINQVNVKSGIYELIIVNDGTPDKSFEIAKELLENCDNVKYVDQVNSGLSSARNNGVLHANGEYIWFVDSDDWIEEDAVYHLQQALCDNIDMLQIQYRCVYDNYEIINPEPFEVLGIMKGSDQLLKKPLPAPAQFTIYRKQFLIDNSLQFKEGIFHEDSEFKPRALYHAKLLKSTPKIIYNYYKRREGSITSQYKLKNGLDTIYVIQSLFTFALSIAPRYKPAIYDLICLDLNSLLNGMSQLNIHEKGVLITNLQKKKNILTALWHAKHIKYKLEGFILRLSPNWSIYFLTYFNKLKKKIYNYFKI